MTLKDKAVTRYNLLTLQAVALASVLADGGGDADQRDRLNKLMRQLAEVRAQFLTRYNEAIEKYTD